LVTTMNNFSSHRMKKHVEVLKYISKASSSEGIVEEEIEDEYYEDETL